MKYQYESTVGEESENLEFPGRKRGQIEERNKKNKGVKVKMKDRLKKVEQKNKLYFIN